MQNFGNYPMSGLSIFHFAPLSNSNSSAARTATCDWYNLLEGEFTSYMKEKYELLWDNGAPPVKERSDLETMITRFSALIVTILGESHPVRGLLLDINHYVTNTAPT